MNKNKKWWKKDGRKTGKKVKHKTKFERDSVFQIRKSSWKRRIKRETKLTLKQSRKQKEDPSMKKTAWFCQIERVKGKTFSKEKSKTWEDFFKKMEGKSQKTERIFFRKDVTKKRK